MWRRVPTLASWHTAYGRIRRTRRKPPSSKLERSLSELTASVRWPTFSLRLGQKPRSRFCSNSDTFLTVVAPLFDANSLFVVVDPSTVHERALFVGIGIDVRFNSRLPARRKWAYHHHRHQRHVYLLMHIMLLLAADRISGKRGACPKSWAWQKGIPAFTRTRNTRNNCIYRPVRCVHEVTTCTRILIQITYGNKVANAT